MRVPYAIARNSRDAELSDVGSTRGGAFAKYAVDSAGEVLLAHALSESGGFHVEGYLEGGRLGEWDVRQSVRCE